jgi:hypothetical protein
MGSNTSAGVLRRCRTRSLFHVIHTQLKRALATKHSDQPLWTLFFFFLLILFLQKEKERDEGPKIRSSSSNNQEKAAMAKGESKVLGYKSTDRVKKRRRRRRLLSLSLQHKVRNKFFFSSFLSFFRKGGVSVSTNG